MSDLIERLAREAGMESALNQGAGSCVSSPGCNGVTQDHLERFAALVAEECAKVCDGRANSANDLAINPDRYPDAKAEYYESEECAAAIRAKFKEQPK